MLSYALAIAVGLSSLILFSTAFLMSDIHRQDDFFWSCVGLFYALVLWFCATRITGGLLLGQTAAVALLISFNWQTLKLRKAIANPEKAQELNNFSVLAAINGLLTRGKSKPQPTVTEMPVKSKVTEETIAIPETPETKIESESTETPETTPATKVETSQPSPTKVAKKPGLLGKFFGGKKQKSIPDKSPATNASITNTKLDDILDEEVSETKTTNSVTELVEQQEPQTVSEDKSDEIDTPQPDISSTEVETETVPQEESTIVSEDKSDEIDTPQPDIPSTEVETETEAEAINPSSETAPQEESTIASEDKSDEIDTPQADISSTEVETEVITTVTENVTEIPSTEIETEKDIVAKVNTPSSETAPPEDSTLKDQPTEADTPQSDIEEKTTSETSEETINPATHEKSGD